MKLLSHNCSSFLPSNLPHPSLWSDRLLAVQGSNPQLDHLAAIADALGVKLFEVAGVKRHHQVDEPDL